MVKREDIANAWDFPSLPGTKSVSNADEDSITMAVEAGYDCLKEFDPNIVDALLFATTTAPYLEKSNASIIASALDLRKDILTIDYTNSLKASTTALAAACDMVNSEKAKNVLVIASDKRNPEPMSMYEYSMGDAAAAFLISDEDLAINILDYLSNTDDNVGPWRREKDGYIRQMQMKYDSLVFFKNMIGAFKALGKRNELDFGSVAKAAIYGSDVRVPGKIGGKLGIPGKAVLDNLFMTLGDTGNTQVFMTLIAGLKRAKSEEIILLGGYGDGADVFLMKVADKNKIKELKKTRRGHLLYSAMTEVVNTYNKYLFFRNSLNKPPYTRKTSTVTIHRDANVVARFHGMKCSKCGTVQYPKWRSCIEPSCMETGNHEEVKLQKRGKIYTFTLDHLEGGDYYQTPIPRCVIDLDGGGRVFLNMTDCDPEEVKIGMDVELTFRKIHEGGDFFNYYWKCRPPRERGGPEMEA